MPESFDSATNRDTTLAERPRDDHRGEGFSPVAPRVYLHRHGAPCSPPTEAGGADDVGRRRLLFTRKVWDGRCQKWRPLERFYCRPRPGPETDGRPVTVSATQYKILLSRGGEINVFPYLVGASKTGEIKQELLDPARCHFFRKYSIQGGDEPRVHFLLHRDATHEFNQPQPGYEYAQIRMKARPLGLLPKLEALSKEIGQIRDVPHWDIGVHAVLYRDMKDSMGDHADDDQGETRIFCVLVETPPTPRVVRVNVFRKLTQTTKKDSKGRRVHRRCDGDEVIQLYLQRGDAYEMDGRMQESYSHGVPSPSTRDKGSSPTEPTIATRGPADYDATSSSRVDGKDGQSYKADSDSAIFQRICLVLRTGIQKTIHADNGRPCKDLLPKKEVVYFFGRNQKLEEGAQLTRRELKDMGAFQASTFSILGATLRI